jgi:hypothetical protein
MYVVRRFALIALCALLPFVMVDRASATVAPRQFVELRLSSMSMTTRSFSNARCLAATIPSATATLEVGGEARGFTSTTTTCGDASFGEFLLAYASFDNAGNTWVTVWGIMSVSRWIDKKWVHQKSVEIGRVDRVPRSSTSTSWSLSSGNASGTFNYTIRTTKVQ